MEAVEKARIAHDIFTWIFGHTQVEVSDEYITMIVHDYLRERGLLRDKEANI